MLCLFSSSFQNLLLIQSNPCWNKVLFTVCSACHHVFIDALTIFKGIVVFCISCLSVVLLSKSGVAAFLNDIDGVHNKSLAFTVGV